MVIIKGKQNLNSEKAEFLANSANCQRVPNLLLDCLWLIKDAHFKISVVILSWRASTLMSRWSSMSDSLAWSEAWGEKPEGEQNQTNWEQLPKRAVASFLVGWAPLHWFKIKTWFVDVHFCEWLRIIKFWILGIYRKKFFGLIWFDEIWNLFYQD